MHKLYELREKLMNELESYADNGKISATDAEAIKYLSSSVDHIDNICEHAEVDEYSMRDDMPMNGTYSRRGYSRNYSMARGRMNAPRDSRGRYSGADGDIEAVKREAMELAEKVKML